MKGLARSHVVQEVVGGGMVPPPPTTHVTLLFVFCDVRPDTDKFSE
jgi:hypothetical protein